MAGSPIIPLPPLPIFVEAPQILTSSYSQIPPDISLPKKMLYFDRKWIAKTGIQEVIAQVWTSQHSGTPMFQVQSKIKDTRISLLKWITSSAQKVHGNQKGS
ncbi:S-adenosylmethionine:tRNAribosyltransferase-isomerase [Striga asiatica]|uniref:S-adenosylmethionine:tRNAribosyltransferase-isomerase n=1 Tax=Striga asiatica TaxID=4170 RepID=A0A5A7QGL6_STRAF|nr:S-adenosylmethionine:tRNAribosyltransferase-isomerase [Striga asiatica]